MVAVLLYHIMLQIWLTLNNILVTSTADQLNKLSRTEADGVTEANSIIADSKDISD